MLFRSGDQFHFLGGLGDLLGAGMEAKRVDMIVAGTVLLEEAAKACEQLRKDTPHG